MTASSAGPLSPPPSPSPSLSVLYVDDDPDISQIVRLSLALDDGIEARFAGSGAEALALVDAGLRPDVAVLDVMMPVMDGPALLARWRADPRTAAIPVLFMTARARDGDIAGYRGLGAAGVIVKPFDPLTLAGEIRRLLAAAAHDGASVTGPWS